MLKPRRQPGGTSKIGPTCGFAASLSPRLVRRAKRSTAVVRLPLLSLIKPQCPLHVILAVCPWIFDISSIGLSGCSFATVRCAVCKPCKLAANFRRSQAHPTDVRLSRKAVPVVSHKVDGKIKSTEYVVSSLFEE